MKIIGLCGGSGSGKGTVAELFSEYGIPSVDTDAVYHDITSCSSPCLDALVLAFGAEIVADGGALDRKRLSNIVFFGEDSEQKREKLNTISHKYVLDKTREILSEYEKQGKKAAFVDAPLLFESGFDRECDLIVAVIADKSVRIDRIMKRDGIDKKSAQRRIDSQLTDEYLKGKSDFIIENSGNFSELKTQVEKIATQILDV